MHSSMNKKINRKLSTNQSVHISTAPIFRELFSLRDINHVTSGALWLSAIDATVQDGRGRRCRGEDGTIICQSWDSDIPSGNLT